MKIICFSKISFLIIILFFCLKAENSYTQNDTLFIDSGFKKINLTEIAKTYSSNKSEALSEIYTYALKKKKDQRDYFYFGYKNEFNYVIFTIKNEDSLSKKLIIEFSNVHIDKIITYRKNNDKYKIINETGIKYPFNSRSIEHRNFLIPIELKKLETQTYLIKLRKEIGRPLVTSIKIFNREVLKKQNLLQYLIIGLYFGLSILSIFFSLFAFYFLRNYSYLIYVLYVIFLGLFISSYLGIFHQFFLDRHLLFNKYNHYIFFGEVSLLLFIIFSQRILNVKENLPRLKKIIDILIITLVIIRLIMHFIFAELFIRFTQLFMKMWYGLILIICLLIVFETIIFFKKNRRRTSLFSVAYLCMLSGAIVTILYHSYGFVNSNIYGLPIMFYSSFFEILFLTFTIVFMVKEIYDERNVLTVQLAHQQQKFLTAFIDGQEKERERVSEELHDNVGSKLSNFKRLFSREYSNKKMDNQIDIICNDVRELSHQLMPSEIKLVGLPGAISDLIIKYSEDGLTIEFNCYEFPENISETITTNLYRVVQESLNNIVKHAEANTVDVQIIGHKDHLTLSIEDDGKGFNKSKLISGIGLRNIKSRIEQLKGNFLLDTSLNKGTSILITIPTN